MVVAQYGSGVVGAGGGRYTEVDFPHLRFEILRNAMGVLRVVTKNFLDRFCVHIHSDQISLSSSDKISVDKQACAGLTGSKVQLISGDVCLHGSLFASCRIPCYKLNVHTLALWEDVLTPKGNRSSK